MVNFNERLAKKQVKRPTNPIEIYNSLDRVTTKGELRKAQITVLENWYNNYRNNKDSIIKLSTGKGKTLIGLLILQSKINSGEGPCLYLCPNKYLVEQTCAEAKSFGIDVCASEREIPIDFENGKQIFVTTVKKLFNGKSYFGTGNNSIPVNTIILDDSHACLEEIHSAFTIKIDREENKNIYASLFQLFETALKNQGNGTFEELKLNNAYNSYLPVPYWSWNNNIEDVVKILTPHADEKFLTFQWSLLKDDLINCSCIFGNDYIEISPYLLPIEKFGSFYNAKNRIYMSATINNDSFFIKHLNINEEVIKNPISIENENWTGEKMILIPSLIDSSLDNDNIMDIFASQPKDPTKRKFGTCVLTPSFKTANPWGKNGAIVSKGNDIGQLIERLKQENFANTIVFANRYDGLDLPDSACRILIFDGMPYTENLNDRYYEDCLSDTDITITKLAQKIEQGLGRNVRGDKDYGAILILGKDLIRFLMANKYKKYFSEQTQKQIEIGLNVVSFLKEDLESNEQVSTPRELVIGVLKQLLKRDEGWKNYYNESMKELNIANKQKILTELSIQQKAEQANCRGKYLEAVAILQKYINENNSNILDNEYGWYLQQIARYQYSCSKSQALNTQRSAYLKNSYLLKPECDIEIKRLKSEDIVQSRKMKNYIASFSQIDDFELEVNDVVDSLRFGIDSEKFEKGIMRLGLMLGFASERPDKQWKEGPDNLWAVAPNEYFVIECKNEIKENRNCISQSETGQMNNTYNWFSKRYQNTKPTYIMIVPTNNVDERGGFNCEVSIIKERGLKLLRDNILSLFKDIKNSGFKNLNETNITKLLELHRLGYKNFDSTYFDKTKEITIIQERKGIV